MGACFNPSRGIAIIQTKAIELIPEEKEEFQSLTRDSNHSNVVVVVVVVSGREVSIPHAG